MEVNEKKKYIFREEDSCSCYLNKPVISNDDMDFLQKNKCLVDNKVKFVGIAVNPQTESIFYGIPKYVQQNELVEKRADVWQLNSNGREHMELLGNVIKKSNELNLFDPNFANEHNKALELENFFIDDYLRNGLYVHRVNETGRSNRGRVKWGKTVSKVQPIISGENVIYTDFYRKMSYIDDGDVVAMIHAAIMKRVSDDLMIQSIEVPVSELFDLIGAPGTAEHDTFLPLINQMKKRLRESYTDRDIHLIKAMIAYLGESIWYSSKNAQKFTTSFELVWENVNREIWGNVQGNTNSDRPEYVFYTDEDGKTTKNIIGSGEQKPDLIRVSEDKKTVTVFDAKYYTVQSVADGALPPSTDISKQVGYLNTIKRDVVKRCGENEKPDFLNIFILPMIMGESDKIPLPYSHKELCGEYGRKEKYLHAGFVKYPGFGFIKALFGDEADNSSADNFDFDDRVDLLAVEPDWLYKAYIGLDCAAERDNKIDGLLSDIQKRKES